MTTLPKSKNITGATTDFLAKPRTEQIAQTSRGIDELAKNFADFSKSSVDRTPAVGLLQKAEKNALVTADSQKKIQRQADSYAAQMRQARIDAINQAFAPRIQREQEEGQGRLARVDAMNFARGIIGSGADTTKVGEQKGLNEKALRAIEDEKAILINEAFGYADALGKERAEQLTKEAQGIATSSVDFYKSQAEKANQAIQMFGKQGVKLDELKKADINTYNTLREISGMSDFEIENMLRSNNPSAKVLKTELVGNKVLTVTQNADGTIDTKTYATDIGGDEELKEVDGVAYGMKLDANGNLVLRKLTQKNYAPTSGGGDFGGFNLNSKQTTLLNGVINKYSADSIIKQGQQVAQIKNVTKMIKDNPNSAGNQLISLYTLVKNLDPDSAVREGELDLANKANSYFGKFTDSLTRISEGRVLNPVATKELADATERLADEWVKSAQRREKQYKSQAGVFGLADPFDAYIGGFDGIGQSGKTINDYRAEFPQASDEELQALMAEEQGL